MESKGEGGHNLKGGGGYMAGYSTADQSLKKPYMII